MIYKILRPIIFKLNPETAHNFAIGFLKFFPNLATIFIGNKKFSNLSQKLFGLDFTSPIGMAAGFDKNAEAIKALHQFGFAFIEVGTVTPKAQSGNDKPRMFRLTQDEAIINRLGFNNKGVDCFLKNIATCRKNLILGINIGKNKDSEDAISDYIFLMEKCYEHSSYLVLNISSPNTKNLRDLQNEDQLDLFLAAIISKKTELQKLHNKNIPIWLKIAPDLTFEEQEKIAATILKNKIDAIIISNTTIFRDDNLQSSYAAQVGGLSGKPLFEKSNQVLSNFYKLTEGKIPLIGVGGIASADDIYTKIKLGASLVQIYSAFIYQGFGVVEKMTEELSEMVEKDGFANVSEAVGIYSRA